MIASLSACSTPKSTPVESKGPRVEGLPRTTANRVGVEILTWHLKDSDTLDSILTARTTPVLNDEEQIQLFTNALTLSKISESELGDLLGEVGGTNAAMSTWCGQITDWRDIRDVRVSNAIIDINNQPLLLNSGQLSMSARAWVEPTVDAAQLRVEVVPRYTTDRKATPSILRSNKPEVHTFADIVTTTDVDPGEVLILTCTTPPAPPLPPPPPTKPKDEDATTDEEFDPEDDPSLDVPAPRTRQTAARPIDLGHALFSIPLSIPGEPPERVVLVLIPRIPTALIPPPDPTQTTRADRSSEALR